MMKMQINDKEYAIIREIANNHRPVQRDIAKRIGISLGLTNIIIKRLVKKGYIKIHETPPRTIIYTLTPKGLAEKTKKTYRYIVGTVKVVEAVKENIRDIINTEYAKGAREFAIQGNGELANLTELEFKNLPYGDVSLSQRELTSNRIICNLLVKNGGSQCKINVLSELSRRGVY